MVKVLPFPIFKEDQAVIHTDDEPTLILPTKRHLLVVTKSGKIQAYGLEDNRVLLHEFTAVNADVSEIHYLPTSDAIVTKERETGHSVITVARIYTNWMSGSVDCGIIAAPQSVSCIATSVDTPFVVVGTAQALSIYCVHSATEQSWVADVSARQVKKVSICGSFLAYCTQSEVFVAMYKISQEPAEDTLTLASLCTNVLREEDLSSSHILSYPSVGMKWTSLKRFTKSVMHSKVSRPQTYDHDITVEFESADGRPSKNDIQQLNLPINQKRVAHILQSTWQILGPVADIHSINLNTDDGWTITASKLMLYYRFEAIDGVVEDIHSLEFMRDGDDQVRLLASNPQRGRLFRLTPTESRLLAAYTYTDETLAAVMSDSFILTISDHAVESFVMRASADHDVSNLLEDPDPCLVNIQPFVGLTQIARVGSNVLLLSKLSEADVLKKRDAVMAAKGTPTKTALMSYRTGTLKSDNEGPIGWNLYQLTLSDPLSIHKEMRKSADTHKEGNPQIFYRLLVEAHFVLESVRSQNSSPEISRLLRSSYSSIADFYYKEVDFGRAATCWARSNTPINTVVTTLLKTPSRGTNEDAVPPQTALFRYLKTVLFDPGMVVYWKPDKDLANKILHVFHKNSPESLGSLLVDSFIAEYSPEIVLPMLENTQVYLGNRVTEEPEWFFVEESSASAVPRFGARTLEEEQLWELSFSLASQYLHHNYVQKAVDSLKKLPERFIVAYLDAKPHVLARAANATAVSFTPRKRTIMIHAKSLPEEITIVSYSPDYVALEHKGASTTSTKLNLSSVLAGSPGTPGSGPGSQNTSPQSSPRQETMLSEMGQFLMKWLPWTVLETLSRGFVTAGVLIGSALEYLESSIQSKLLCTVYLEFVILHLRDQLPDENAHKLRQDLIHRLIRQYADIATSPNDALEEYYLLLQARDSRPSKGEISFENTWKDFHTRVFIERRASDLWVNRLPPFTDQTRVLEGKYGLDAYFYLRKIQGLLLAELEGESTPAKVELAKWTLNYVRELVSSLEGLEGASSLSGTEMLSAVQFVCLPYVGGLNEAIEILLESHPHSVVDFAKQSCGKEAVAWKFLLSKLLEPALSESDICDWTLVEAVLEHAAAILQPEEFLSIIPDDANLRYFLPFIELSLSRAVGSELLTVIRAHAREELEAEVRAGGSGFSTRFLMTS